jgi:hypothetical protein
MMEIQAFARSEGFLGLSQRLRPDGRAWKKEREIFLLNLFAKKKPGRRTKNLNYERTGPDV